MTFAATANAIVYTGAEPYFIDCELEDVLGDKQYYYGKNVGALEGVLEGQPHDLRDYFFMDYVEGLSAVVDDFEGITRRQRETYSAAFPRTGAKLRAARETYLKGDS